MAAIWKLPVVFVCENNGYAQATPVEYAVAVKNIADRAAAYGMPGVVVDGQDVVAVFEAAVRAVTRARAGQGPSLIECKTYRYYGHHQGDDPLRYRTSDEERSARERDCVLRFRSYVREHDLVSAGETRRDRRPSRRAARRRGRVRGGEPAARPLRTARPRVRGITMTAPTVASRELTFSQAINEAIRQEMRRDPTVIVIGEDVAGAAGRAHLGLVDAWGGPLRATRGLVQEFGPERVIDTPIAEMGFVGAAVGAAMTGLRPIVEIMFVDLIGVCYDQIVNQAAKMHYMMGGQIESADGHPHRLRHAAADKRTYGGGAAAQHSQTLYAVLAHVPGLKVVVPSTAYNAKGLTDGRHSRRRPGRGDGAQVPRLRGEGRCAVDAYTCPIGKADVVRTGTDVTLCGIGRMTHVCLEAAERLAAEGISAEVIDVLTLAPLDEDTILESVRRTHRLVVVDEDTPVASMARDIAAIAADKCFDWLDAPVKTVTPPDTPMPFAAVLEAEYIPNADKVVGTVRALLGVKRIMAHPS